MRDLQRLEELSSAAALGLWADDVVLALDRATSGIPLAEDDKQLLNGAAEMLEAAVQRTEEPLAAARSARSLAATNTALSIVAMLVREQPGSDERQLLNATANVLRHVSMGEPSEANSQIENAMELFGLLGKHQLVESNSVLTSRKDWSTWMATTSTSNSS